MTVLQRFRDRLAADTRRAATEKAAQLAREDAMRDTTDALPARSLLRSASALLRYLNRIADTEGNH